MQEYLLPYLDNNGREQMTKATAANLEAAYNKACTELGVTYVQDFLPDLIEAGVHNSKLSNEDRAYICATLSLTPEQYLHLIDSRQYELAS